MEGKGTFPIDSMTHNSSIVTSSLFIARHRLAMDIGAFHSWEKLIEGETIEELTSKDEEEDQTQACYLLESPKPTDLYQCLL
jgi:hypothetical protein